MFDREVDLDLRDQTGPGADGPSDLVAEACTLAERLLAGTDRAERWRDRRRRRRLAALLADRRGLELALALTDEVSRIADDRAAALRFASITASHGSAALGPLDRAMVRAGAQLALVAPRRVMPLVRRRLRHETRGVVLPAADPAFARYLASRRRQGARLNVNLLGEAILGEGEAKRRLDDLVALLRRPDVDYVSVKISAISSQVQALCFAETVDAVAARLRTLYDAALAAAGGPCFVNLDMEEFRDLALTTTTFRTVLDEEPYRSLTAGIVLQAYLPDSHEALGELCEWARRRVQAGGAPIKVRLVKGANLAMEAVEAELRGWPQAPYATKAEVDASYKRMLDVVLDPRYDRAVRVGVASHNLYESAWAVVRARAAGASHRLELEMLEGMATAAAEAARDEAGAVLLYAPIVADAEFEAALAYLARRLDENAAPENFLRSLLRRRPGERLPDEARRFEAAVAARHGVRTSSHRTQDRSRPDPEPPLTEPFSNEPDTDWTRPANRTWLADELARFAAETAGGTSPVHAVVDGREVPAPLTGRSTDPSQPDRRYPYVEADLDLVDEAVAVARRAAAGWAARTTTERAEVVHRIGAAVAAGRGRILAAMASDAGKTVAEGDPEVSEAVDFARWYARSALDLEATAAATGARFAPHGVVVVASPWNFPFAIPLGGVTAALAAGNTVILKPAPESVRTGRLVADCCWAAGVPRDVLQFLPCPDDEVGRRLVTHEDVDAVVLTGAYGTAQLFLGWRHDLRLRAETSGKNAVVVTAAADLDLAIRDLVRSAFGHAGQKCSAASLSLVEASVHDDPRFQARLADAVASLRVGPAAALTTDVGPLIRPPEGPLLRALTTLDPGETWLVEPRRLDAGGHLWRPGVRLGVSPDSWFFATECFGPVLGLVRVPDLGTAIEWQNRSDYGLTAGLHSLDPDEIRRWCDAVEAGNLYVNRGTTGAVVRRQPFGGWKRSAMGATAKAGGPDYVASLGTWRGPVPAGPPSAADVAALRAEWAGMAAGSDAAALRAERNLHRYRPLPAVLLRAGAGAQPAAVAWAVAAARVAGTRVEVSTAEPLGALGVDVQIETEARLAERIAAGGPARLRLLGGVGEAVLRATHAAGTAVDDAPVLPIPELELRRWAREQALSITTHRHGHPTPPPL